VLKPTHICSVSTATPRRFLLASASGVLLALSAVFPSLFFFIWMAFAPLFVALRGQPAAKRLQLGLLTGMIYFGGAVHWLCWSISQFFAFSASVAFLLFFCFLVWHAFVFALFAALLRRQSSTNPRLLFPALLWVVLEHYYPMLFPWQCGNVLQPHLAAIQLSEVTGGAGLSFLILLVNNFLLHAYEQRHRRAAWQLSMTAAIGIMLALDAYGYWRLTQVEAEPLAHPFLVAIVQSNTPARRDTNEEVLRQSLHEYVQLSLSAMIDKPALIVWPEVAVRTTLRENATIQDALFTLAEQVETPLLVGALDRTSHGETLNSAFLISPAGEIFGSYSKTRLLPFAESLPWPLQVFDRWWPSAGFVAGNDANPLLLPDARFALSICYESLWPGFFRRAVTDGAEFLVNLTNDVWLGNTSGPWNHLQASVMRAVENRRWLVRAANSGISAIIAPSGRIVARTELSTITTIHKYIALRQETTLYVHWGDWFVLVCLGGIGLETVVSLWLRIQPKKE
jgi:apolipoprotein N-acyltransferase